MKIIVKQWDIEKISSDVLVVPVFKGIQNAEPDFVKLDNLLNNCISQAIEDNGGITEEGSVNMFFTNKRMKTPKLLLIGLGDAEKLTTEKIRKAGGIIARFVGKRDVERLAIISFGFALKKITIEQATQVIVEGLLLGSYSFDRYKTDEKTKAKKKLSSLILLPQNEFDVGKIEEGAQRAVALNESVCITRDLVNEPSNIVTPTYLAKFAKNLCKSSKLKCKIYNTADLKKENMNCFLGVAKGSAEPPKLVRLDYNGAKGAKVDFVLVGKGVCFDSGGINIKPSGHIEDMKQDMGGAAVVLGIMNALTKLKIELNVVGLCACVENMPGAAAQKPSDVVVSASGKTVEIGNTDAEGRLILADTLDYATKIKPGAIINFATLTGAVIVALGKNIAGIMGNNEDLINELIQSSKTVDERIWQLPLLDIHKEDIKSDIADIKNIGRGKGCAGSIAAGAFLREFVDDTPWAHFDIAGTCWVDKAEGWNPQGATGMGVRLIVDFLQKHAKN